ncbi:hypothetical protein CBR_g23970 [Chara braunii]|uniref:Peptidase S9 prolyl oligopeptidase catalytic domain-containing protein n=1 Tax=Chara braunii TaxID=69332 RepID=A0A388L5E8_CHABU|nr:hypothetical protein CBR_g23970 [Chara braunii]|eukprot:GBG77526.1 hypothetical protein CBR_g23970 [Chara braunii]
MNALRTLRGSAGALVESGGVLIATAKRVESLRSPVGSHSLVRRGAQVVVRRRSVDSGLGELLGEKPFSSGTGTGHHRSTCADYHTTIFYAEEGEDAIWRRRSRLPITVCGSDARGGLAAGTEISEDNMGNDKQIEAPYGAWRSPISSDVATGKMLRLGGAAIDDDGRVIWLEGRPSESGRSVLVREREGPGDGDGDGGERPPLSFSSAVEESSIAGEDLTPEGFDVRSRVHEYGGGAFTIWRDSILFTNGPDQSIYHQRISNKDDSGTGTSIARAITPAEEGQVLRYADGVVDERFNRIVCVREHHGRGGEPANEIVGVKLARDAGGGDGGIEQRTRREEEKEVEVLVSGDDFYMFPRISPDGKRLAWISWCHPNMPWDQTCLWVGDISQSGKIDKKICVAGKSEGLLEAPTEPSWSPSGELFFVSDRGSGWWNLYRWIDSPPSSSDGGGFVEAVLAMEAEFSRPAWIFGNRSYTFAPDWHSHPTIIAVYRQNGIANLGLIDVRRMRLTPVETGYTEIFSVQCGGAAGRVVMHAASGVQPESIVDVKIDYERRSATTKVIKSACDVDVAKVFEGYLSVPRVVEFPTTVYDDGEEEEEEAEGAVGKEGGVKGGSEERKWTAFALFYPPSNPDYVAPKGEKPPLLVRIHGGPTAAADTALRLSYQYFTSRGWAIADVNYGGSTGYGRAFRERLKGRLGIVDVEDCCRCAEYLVAQGMVDGNRLTIEGSSAGGYTTLAALTFRDTFSAGSSRYGIADLRILAEETHKFEARYLDGLIGPLSTYGHAYDDRSPINHVENLRRPLILFHGLEDAVVPPSQSRAIYTAVKEKGLPVALIEFEGERHGFRKAENLKKTLEYQLLFFARVLPGGIQLADDIEHFDIDNLHD